jgi:hypothetical protein
MFLNCHNKFILSFNNEAISVNGQGLWFFLPQYLREILNLSVISTASENVVIVFKFMFKKSRGVNIMDWLQIGDNFLPYISSHIMLTHRGSNCGGAISQIWP